MSQRQFSMNTYWKKTFCETSPRLSYANSGLDFEQWEKKAREKLMELLGDFPEKVPLNAEIESVEDCGEYERRKVVFDSEKNMSVPCYVLVPQNIKSDSGLPAILCSHGHGAYGKEPVAGVRTLKGQRDDIELMNYNYAEQMAKAGFVTLVPDLRGFGERGLTAEAYKGCDLCNMNYIRGTLLERYPLTLNIWDMKCCIDYLETMPEVDANRIGMMGLSQGGTMTAFTTAVEPRIKAADIIGYINPIYDFGIQRDNICGSQVLPGLYCWFDTFDIAGMIAPRPLLMEMGKNDTCFYYSDMLKGYDRVSEIYDAASAGENLSADIHDGGHAFSGNKAFAFFKKYL